MRHWTALARYLSLLTPQKATLWCYLIWYLSTVAHHFDPSPGLWLNSLGLSMVIGIALTLSVGGSLRPPADRWQIFRLFLTPFCVSSFAATIKGKDFILIVPPSLAEFLHSTGSCVVFLLVWWGIRAQARARCPTADQPG